MAPSTDRRVNKMFRGDCIASLAALITLWATYTFVFFRIFSLAGSDAVLIALSIGAGLVLLFNTAAIWAMISHYAEDKQNIYGLDLHYLDIANKSKR
jgi:hypothetical protein